MDDTHMNKTRTHCNTLQHTVSHWNKLQHTATYCNTHVNDAHAHCNTPQLEMGADFDSDVFDALCANLMIDAPEDPFDRSQVIVESEECAPEIAAAAGEGGGGGGGEGGCDMHTHTHTHVHTSVDTPSPFFVRAWSTLSDSADRYTFLKVTKRERERCGRETQRGGFRV